MNVPSNKMYEHRPMSMDHAAFQDTEDMSTKYVRIGGIVS